MEIRNEESEAAKLASLIARAWKKKEAVSVQSSFAGGQTTEIVKCRTIKTVEGGEKEFLESRKLVFAASGGRSVDLTKLAPRAIFLNIWYQPDVPESVSPELFAVETVELADGKKINFIYYPGINRVGDRISLLHEIGHLETSAARLAALKAEEELREAYDDSVAEGRRKAGEGEILARLNAKHKAFHPIDEEAALNFLELSSRAERLAWARALRLYRGFLKTGIDLEPSFTTLKDLRDYVHSREALESYEVQAREYFTKNPELAGFYSRRRKEGKRGAKKD